MVHSEQSPRVNTKTWMVISSHPWSRRTKLQWHGISCMQSASTRALVGAEKLRGRCPPFTGWWFFLRWTSDPAASEAVSGPLVSVQPPHGLHVDGFVWIIRLSHAVGCNLRNLGRRDSCSGGSGPANCAQGLPFSHSPHPQTQASSEASSAWTFRASWGGRCSAGRRCSGGGVQVGLMWSWEECNGLRECTRNSAISRHGGPGWSASSHRWNTVGYVPLSDPPTSDTGTPDTAQRVFGLRDLSTI